jgi:hypothetical protein
MKCGLARNLTLVTIGNLDVVPSPWTDNPTEENSTLGQRKVYSWATQKKARDIECGCLMRERSKSHET